MSHGRELSQTHEGNLKRVAFVGHRQVTDAYLLALAQHHKGKLATFENGIADLIQVSKERRQHITMLQA
jgi:predicted nucleic acid-binding protein